MRRFMFFPAILAVLTAALGAQNTRVVVHPGDTLTVIGAAGPVVAPVLPPPVAVVSHEPAGMATQVNTGAIHALPAGFTVFSPTTMTAQGEAAGNLSVAPDEGLRLTYLPSLAGGYSPARFGIPLAAPGTGWFYERERVRFSTNWNLNGSVSIKLAEPRTATTQQNDIVVLMSDNRTTDLYLVLAQQGSTTRNLPAPKTPKWTYAAVDSAGRIAVGTWHTLEVLFQPESVPGRGDGVYTSWVDGAQADRETNVAWLAAGEAVGWPYLLFDPTFGGAAATVHPLAAMTVDVDSIYVSTR